jgi:hypothetical protein
MATIITKELADRIEQAMINVKIRKHGNIFLCCGFLLILLGSMLLNGYLGFLLWPAEFHHDAFTGSVLHLLLGVIPWLMGVVLITLGAKRAWDILMTGLVSIGLGCLMALSAIFMATDHKGALGFLAIFICGVIFGTGTRMFLNLYTNKVHRTA